MHLGLWGLQSNWGIENCHILVAHCSLLWFGWQTRGRWAETARIRKVSREENRIQDASSWSGMPQAFCGDATSEQTQVVVFHQVTWWLVAGVGGKVVS